MKTVNLSDFTENPDNPSKISDADFERLVGKIRRVPDALAAHRIAFVTDRGKPFVVISGNKRLRALKKIHGETAKVNAAWFEDVTNLTDDQRKEFIVSANVSDGEWDLDKLLAQYDQSQLAELLDPSAMEPILAELEKRPELRVTDDDGAPTERDDIEYHEFVGKFDAKHTTDDCYTPPNIYAAVMDWCCGHYGIEARNVVRPFRPGGDYQAEVYESNAVVVDNPPFSILADICRWYKAHGIKFFLFCPALTPFTCGGVFNTVICGISITYANGAKVATSFITNMGEYLVETAPDLFDTLKEINRENEHEITRDIPKYKYPDCVVTAAAIKYLNIHHTDFKLKREDAVFIRCLDEQKEKGCGLFGGGYLLSERAAAERAAAERAAAERAAAKEWKLSERELALQKTIGAQ